jgi:ferritin
MFTLGPVFDQDLEAGVNEQINAELSAHYTYLSMVRRNNKRNYSYLIYLGIL